MKMVRSQRPASAFLPTCDNVPSGDHSPTTISDSAPVLGAISVRKPPSGSGRPPEDLLEGLLFYCKINVTTFGEPRLLRFLGIGRACLKLKV